MPGVTLPEYIAKNPETDRLPFLRDVAEGLNYLHSRHVVRGDIKGINILVDIAGDLPRACIADLGIAIVTKNIYSRRPATRQETHTLLWSAPEILRTKNVENPTTESDIYSFGMVMFEVFTGDVPFSDKPELSAVFAITQGERPPRPTDPSCTDDLWNLVQRCRNDDPRSRPSIAEVLKILPPSPV